jgi:prepilin-type N-terminal cleavage/methylation domain-containing protein
MKIEKKTRSNGFTLIELLIVVVIIGVLAAIAIPKFSATREKAYVSAMKSDLRKLAGKQEIYYSDNFQYTTDLATLEFLLSEAVTVGIGAASGTGWSATATHAGTSVSCAMFYGDASAVSPATMPNIVTCG